MQLFIVPFRSHNILNTGHTNGTIAVTVDIMKRGRKGKHWNTLERYHIYKIRKDNLHMNDTYRYTTPHIRVITRALHQMAAHTHPVTLYGRQSIHKVYIYRRINNTTTQAG
jgi:hypothetical protein